MRNLMILPALGLLLASCISNQPKEAGNDENTAYTLKIAYNVLVNPEADNYDIVVMNLDGSEKTNITNHEDVAWTYLGGTNGLFFISDRDTCARCFFLYHTTTDGKNIRKVSDIRLRDSWMSTRYNGSEIIVNPHRDVDSAFYILNMEGEMVRRVSHHLAYGNDPCFSPDGKSIVFRGADKKSKRDAGFSDELYIMAEDGSNLRKLTNYPAGDTTAPWYAYKAGPPRWSAHNLISYQSFQRGKYRLFAIAPDGSNPQELIAMEYDQGWHDWSPDGQWLAIEVFDTPQTQFHIALVNWETKEANIITDTAFQYQQAPAFIRVTE